MLARLLEKFIKDRVNFKTQFGELSDGTPWTKIWYNDPTGDYSKQLSGLYPETIDFEGNPPEFTHQITLV